MATASPGLSRAEVAERAGVSPQLVGQLLELGILKERPDGSLDPFEFRKIGIATAIVDAGISLDAVAEGMRRGLVGLDFVAQPEYSRFLGLTRETFAEASARTGVPVEDLALIREAVGSGSPARPDDYVREAEAPVIEFVMLQSRAGFTMAGIHRLLRTLGDTSRRFAEAEAEWWRSEVIEPNIAAGKPAESVGGQDLSFALSSSLERATAAVMRAAETQTWTANIVGGFEKLLAKAGIVTAMERQPAICFLDITGYTRLTQERGDRAAAELADELNRLVQRGSANRGGRPVKWLGDGVMFYFREPGPGVEAALDMVEGITDAGLPPAHVGLHSGPVVMQSGDYYGQTVNMAARIADYARPGEVLVSRAVVEAASPRNVSFDDIGAVELKGVTGTVELAAARRSASAS
jgi:adenylate cyclase